MLGHFSAPNRPVPCVFDGYFRLLNVILTLQLKTKCTTPRADLQSSVVLLQAPAAAQASLSSYNLEGPSSHSAALSLLCGAHTWLPHCLDQVSARAQT